ncbi:3 beta-hydroxysteroid dehydrogenase/Delta 5--_4-isomerase [Pontiella desulfatans]|uniref:3 beta-hydroxysteroid dehydrogenase/Delta 5-->4-isomerase n=1 Tax=Pontiella desulfatans TaxID=2750659 RepID=A0A6C2TXZ9_PONDE|nr:SDR family oxidoreductase [Pontiella desulfatans]VGO12211.1 3 beta-hydroxysteroid dehydrogenase/Delta 5-->4-isomerase [Pontiella desulfatans]
MAENLEELVSAELPTEPCPDMGRVLVAGATGYIGGRLVPELIGRGYKVRVMVRAESPEHEDRWPDAEVAVADALIEDEVSEALEGVDTAYYLIHSMLIGLHKFEDADIRAARNFRMAAERQGVNRIIYLGGLGDTQTTLSPHLASRSQVAEEFSKGQVPTTILRAAIIIGSGSASYEMINHLVRRIPVFLVPAWAKTRCQPIGLRDVIKYLVGVLELTETAGHSYDIGGSDILTYEEMLKMHAGILGKKRAFVPSPISSIGFYSYITSLLTPVPAAITWCLMESVTHDVVCGENDIVDLIPFRRISCKEALVLALSREEQDSVSTRWSDSYPPDYELAIKLSEIEGVPTYTSSYSLVTSKTAEALFKSITHIGGRNGWFHSTFLWRIRGAIDRLLRGVGTTRGRRSASGLRVNDVVDFWRVEEIHYHRQLLLRAEMKVPGYAWLEFRVDPVSGEKNRLSVNAYYKTKGLWGRTYWYIFLPFHHFIFEDLIKQIERRG